MVMEARIACKQQVRGFVNPGTPLLSNPSLLPVHIFPLSVMAILCALSSLAISASALLRQEFSES